MEGGLRLRARGVWLAFALAQSGARACLASSAKGADRIDRLVSRATGLSRKDTTRLLKQRRVTVGGEPIVDGGKRFSALELASTLVDGEPLDLSPPPLLVEYHKPVGVHSTMSDSWGRDDLSEALGEAPPSWSALLHPVGRLDADTSGLLLFSRDGQLTQRLLHPRHAVEKEYLATVGGDVHVLDDGGEALRAQLRAGVATTEGRHTAELLEASAPDAASLEAVEETAALGRAPGAANTADSAPAPVATLRLIVREGKHRMVRRMLANAGHPVLALHRARFGAVRLDESELPAGCLRAVDGEGLAWAEELAAAASGA